MTSEPLPMPADWRTRDFDFVLPPELIAQQPVEPRDAARLLHVGRGEMTDRHVYDLPALLRSDDLLVLNNTKVIPARLFGRRDAMKVELLLHKRLPDASDIEWLAFARPGKRLRVGDTIIFGSDFSATVLEKRDSGDIRVGFSADSSQFFDRLHRYGEPPLPPYIKRESQAARQDSERYQTIYADHAGAVAAPTAGLHFTPELFARLDAKGIERVMVTLHVGAGTFLPVKADYIKDHVMHAEWGEIPAATADIINRARAQGRRIVAVGTTSLRLLESAAADDGAIQPFNGDTTIFIYPGYRFKCVNALMTNFHLPQSTLFMLVSAFAGMERMQKAYAHAIQQGYRFYSYGDACLLEAAP